MKVLAIVVTPWLVFLLAGPPGFAQTVTSEPTDSEAADVTRFLADRADYVASKSPSGDLEAEAQEHIEALAELASQLETEIRAGKTKDETRRIYEALRARRVAVIGLGVRGDIGVSGTDIQLFEQLLAELSAYYRSR